MKGLKILDPKLYTTLITLGIKIQIIHLFKNFKRKKYFSIKLKYNRVQKIHLKHLCKLPIHICRQPHKLFLNSRHKLDQPHTQQKQMMNYSIYVPTINIIKLTHFHLMSMFTLSFHLVLSNKFTSLSPFFCRKAQRKKIIQKKRRIF